MVDRVTLQIRDYNGETSKFGINVPELTALNFFAVRDLVNDLHDSLSFITLGRQMKSTHTLTDVYAGTRFLEPNAQREVKWLVSLRDVTQFFDGANTIVNPNYGAIWTIEIPTADLQYLELGQDVVDLTAPNFADFVGLLESIAISPFGGNENEVLEIRHVGRNT